MFIQKFTKRDFGFSVLTGLIAGTIGWRILEFLKVRELSYGAWDCIDGVCAPVHALPWSSLVIIIPIVWILGVLLGYFLGQWLEFFNQFGKFAAIGFTNFAVTAGVLNLLLAATGFVDGKGFALINSIGFLAGVLSSYIWNRYWAFRATAQNGGGVQFLKFFVVTIIAFGVNLIVASFIVNYIPAVLGLDAHQWANVGTVVGSAVGLIFSFVGFKLAVFRR